MALDGAAANLTKELEQEWRILRFMAPSFLYEQIKKPLSVYIVLHEFHYHDDFIVFCLFDFCCQFYHMWESKLRYSQTLVPTKKKQIHSTQ